MTSVLEGAKKLVSRSSDIGTRITGLEQAVTASRGRVDDQVVEEAHVVADRAASRLRLSADHTVVAIAGATGSGKSSTFNALTELELSAVGVRRPTTSWASACVWGSEGASELLEWLGIPARHQVTRDSLLSSGREDKMLQGVVLLDLPDHDSTEVSHHLEVDRLVQLADTLVWVLDPQKYADAAVHDRYLKPLANHQEVVLVVLNQIDVVPEGRREAMLDDVRRLLAADGLAGVPVLGVSAREGWGVDELRTEIAKRVAAKKATRQRLEADIKAAATKLQEATGEGKVRGLAKDRVTALDDAFAEAAGVPTVVKAVEDSTRLRANRATGWPVTSWLSRLKPDPLKRLHLDLGSAGKALTGTARTSMPQATQVQRARVDTEVRALADQVSEGLARPWASAVRRASTTRLDDLGDRLDKALAGSDLGATRIPIWAGLVRVLQWLLIITAVVGAVWLGLLAFGAYLQINDVPTPEVAGLAVPALLLLGGVLAGVLLALLCRVLVGLTARGRARAADKQLRGAISEVSRELVVEPVEAELAAYSSARSGLDAALR
ncbi:MAG: 50S ribosome-binding GTPase [Nocardioides sp.]|nr:50S ribosome-binding GTPase [Nocardioides sp.]